MESVKVLETQLLSWCVPAHNFAPSVPLQLPLRTFPREGGIPPPAAKMSRSICNMPSATFVNDRRVKQPVRLVFWNLFTASPSACCKDIELSYLQGQHTLEPERVGEVVIRGAAVTSGYWGDPRATADAIDSQGWLHTGDLGWFDTGGRLMLCGRQKDMIKTGGENVHASEVESAVAALPGVQEAAGVGLPHLRFGEAVSVLLSVQTPKDGSIREPILGRVAEAGAGNSQVPLLMNTHDLAMLQKKLKQAGLSAFKVPRMVAISQLPLPRTATGKVDKRTIKSILQQLTASDQRAAKTGTWHRSAL